MYDGGWMDHQTKSETFIPIAKPKVTGCRVVFKTGMFCS
jgi:hypothetical protein